MRTRVMWLTRNKTYIGSEYQLFHFRDHPKLYKGSYCSTAKKGDCIPWKCFSVEDWENHMAIKLQPGERKKIEIREV